MSFTRIPQMSFPLGRFPVGQTIQGEIIQIEDYGVMVDVGAEHPTRVWTSELSMVEIQSPIEVVQLHQTRQFLVVGKYTGHYSCFLKGCTPEALEESDRLNKIAQERASISANRPVSCDELIVHGDLVSVHDDGVYVKIQWFLCSNNPPQIALSIRQLERKILWQRLKQLQSENVTVYSTVREIFKRSGPILDIEGEKGWLASIDRRDADLVVGDTGPFKITDVTQYWKPDGFEYSAILTRRETWDKLQELAMGKITEGRVRAVKPYGVWVELDGLSGLMHHSNIMFHSARSADFFEIGDRVDVIVDYINWQRPFVSLKLPPWISLAAYHGVFS